MAVLTDDERTNITELLTSAVAPSPAPRAALAALLHETLKEELDVSGKTRTLAVQTIEICIRSDYTLTPPAIYPVVEFLVQSGRVELASLLERLKRRPPVQAGPMQARILSSRLPFADREGLRTILRDMFSIEGAEPILLVGGETQSGKSYVSELVEYCCVNSANFIFCKFAVTSKTAGADATALAVAKDLVSQLGGDPKDAPKQTSNLEAWLPELANWVITNANTASAGVRVWLAIDGLRQGFVLPETGRFLAELARKCTLGVAAKRHRLLLSDFSEEYAGMLPIRVKQYRTEPITLADVQAIVSEIIEASAFPQNDKPTLSQEALKTVLDGLSPPLSEMTILGQRLQALIARAAL
jgi:hypothetical protein